MPVRGTAANNPRSCSCPSLRDLALLPVLPVTCTAAGSSSRPRSAQRGAVQCQPPGEAELCGAGPRHSFMMHDWSSKVQLWFLRGGCSARICPAEDARAQQVIECRAQWRQGWSAAAAAAAPGFAVGGSFLHRTHGLGCGSAIHRARQASQEATRKRAGSGSRRQRRRQGPGEAAAQASRT